MAGPAPATLHSNQDRSARPVRCSAGLSTCASGDDPRHDSPKLAKHRATPQHDADEKAKDVCRDTSKYRNERTFVHRRQRQDDRRGQRAPDVMGHVAHPPVRRVHGPHSFFHYRLTLRGRHGLKFRNINRHTVRLQVDNGPAFTGGGRRPAFGAQGPSWPRSSVRRSRGRSSSRRPPRPRSGAVGGDSPAEVPPLFRHPPTFSCGPAADCVGCGGSGVAVMPGPGI
jgi:hypothetical protein